MNILLLVQNEQRVILDRFYEAIATYCDNCDIRRLSDDEQADLKNYFKKNVEINKYDRIVFFVRFKKIIPQKNFFYSIPNLVFLEHDAWQNYADCKYRGAYSRHYRALPWARIICSGYTITQQLISEGFDVEFVPKGYDQTLLKNLGSPRNTELSFVGSIKNRIYKHRKEFLQQLSARENLEIIRTNSGADYLHKLNDIRIFVTADMGMHEYMIKNFEAMACGCVLFAYDQGELENQAIGFRDMENIVLFASVEEFLNKLQMLREQPVLVEKIAAAGQAFVEQNYTFDAIGEKVVAALRPELRQPPPKLSLLSKLRRQFFSA